MFESFVRLTILEDLYAIAKDQESVWDIILSGVGLKNDESAEYKFFQWFRQHTGKTTVAYLEKKLSGSDRELQIKAAKVVLYLLGKEFDPEAAKLGPNFAQLKKMAAKHNLWTGGSLGIESLQQLINSEIAALIDLCSELALIIEGSAYEDPYRKSDIAALGNFQQALNVKLGVVPGLDLDALEELDIRLAQALQEATEIISRAKILQENASQLILFIGAGAGESDEVNALFLLRHEYVMVLVGVLTNKNFVSSVNVVNMQYLDFAGTVANLKRDRILKRFSEIVRLVGDARRIQPPTLGAGDDIYLKMDTVIQQMDKYVWEKMNGGTLELVVRAETGVNLWALQASIFILYALSLRMTNDMNKSEIGSANFRNEQNTALAKIRKELVGLFNAQDFKRFSDRAEPIRKSLQDIAEAIQHEAKVDLGIHLLITAVASLLTFGAAAIARLALLGETLAVVRTADAASSVVLLVEAGTFTVAELAGEKLAFDKPVTISRAAQDFLSNAAFFGLFRVLGRLTAPLARGRTVLGIIAPHLANLAATTGISALMTRLQTGEWPQDIAQFLLLSIASYAVIAGINAAAMKVATPALEAQVRKLVTALDKENTALYIRYQQAIESGSLTEPEFEQLRKRKLELHRGARELARFLHQEGLMTEEQLQAIEEDLQSMDDVATKARFIAPQPQLVGRDGGRLVRALPLPERTTGLVRLGSSNVYRFDPSHPPDVPSLLAQYEASGYRVQRYPGGVIRVLTGGGRTVFLLEPGPAVPALPALTAGPIVSGPLQPVTLLKKLAVNPSPTDLADLKIINPNLVSTLETEFQESTALAALGLIFEQRGNLKTRWPVTSIRGLAKMLQLERGISRSTVRRLFLARSSADLADIFEKFNRIADWSGANLLVDAELDPARSVLLINVYDAMGHLRPPDGMTRKAVRGLLRWAQEAATLDEVVQKLRDIDPSRRLARLEADSPIKDPTLRPTSHAEDVLRAQSVDIRPGLNLFHGTVADVIQAIDTIAHQKGGGFSEPRVRNLLEIEVRNYRQLAADYQAGGNVERNLIGARNEIDGVIFLMERGETVIALGPAKIIIDPNAYPVTRGRLVNWPKNIQVQLDMASRRVDGRFVNVETTTGKLSLPRSLEFLDPASNLPPGNIDYNLLDPDNNANERKFIQFIKMRAAAYFARDLAKAFGDATAETPDLIFRGETTEQARRALISMGFTVLN
jgi:hypothetical protein